MMCGDIAEVQDKTLLYNKPDAERDNVDGANVIRWIDPERLCLIIAIVKKECLIMTCGTVGFIRTRALVKLNG